MLTFAVLGYSRASVNGCPHVLIYDMCMFLLKEAVKWRQTESKLEVLVASMEPPERRRLSFFCIGAVSVEHLEHFVDVLAF